MFEWTYDHEICRETCLYVPIGAKPKKHQSLCKNCCHGCELSDDVSS